MPSTCLPKKGWNSRLHKEFTPFQCLRINPRPASTWDREFLSSDRTERIQIPSAFPWGNQPSVIQRPFQEENQARIWEDPPQSLCLETITRNSEGRGRYKIRGNQHQTRSQKIYVQIQSRDNARPAPNPAGAHEALKSSPGNAAAPLSQPHIQGHHHHKSQDGGPGRQLPVAAAGREGRGERLGRGKRRSRPSRAGEGPFPGSHLVCASGMMSSITT